MNFGERCGSSPVLCVSSTNKAFQRLGLDISNLISVLCSRNQNTNLMKTYIQSPLFVVAYGSDCDGCNSGHVSRFFSPKLAQFAAKSINEWSDGLIYACVDEVKAIEYCRAFNIPLKSLTHVDAI